MTEPPSAECFWLLDVRNLWPGEKIADAAPSVLRLLSPKERKSAQAFHFIKDARLSVGSSLLKRTFITKTLNFPWAEIDFSRQGHAQHGKPCFQSPETNMPSVDFNVSHQAGLVALAGGRASAATYGVDIVCVNERNDYASIAKTGFDHWVDVFEQVFSPADISSIKNGPQEDHNPTEDPMVARLRLFYAFWALKEAYIKLVGEALLATWLKEVEFRNVRAPAPSLDGDQQTWGERTSDIEVWFRGDRLNDVIMVLQAFENDYMVATAIQESPVRSGDEGCLPNYSLLVPDRDIYPYATAFEDQSTS